MTSLAATDSGWRPAPRPVSATWQQALKDAVRDPLELCRLLELPPELATTVQQAAKDFPLFAPRAYIARMRLGDVRDPLLAQVLPVADELTSVGSFTADPVGDQQATLRPGLLHKYRTRVLMVTTGACAVHCRYCFRRHFPYQGGPRSADDWQPALTQIAADRSLREVILSGGDPLTLVDEHLARLAESLAEIGHLRRLRIHTRLPIMIPERVTEALLDWLTGTRLTPVMVIHANHPAELDDAVAASLELLSQRGVMLLNQAVLLRGVNDSVDCLAELSERLADLRVVPYYLHQLDRVSGAAHFEVPEAEGRRLVSQLRRRLSGYLVPRYVREVPGAASKVPLM